MRTFVKFSAIFLIIGCLAIASSGCTLVLQKGRTSDKEKIESLSEKAQRLKMTEDELSELKKAHDALQKSLKKEISAREISLGIEGKGLVITFVDRILFNSGKAKLRSQAHSALDKVVKVCRKTVADKEIGIEGHTDNQPIKHSGWKSNWELSTARATSVLHYLVKKGIAPQRLSVTGFGEYQPLVSNQTPQGKEKNRRVEIVILSGSKSRARPDLKGSKYIK